MIFKSILFKEREDIQKAVATGMPDFFIDLNLNQVIDAVTKDKELYNLKPFFYTPLQDKDAIIYRQEIMIDMEGADLFEYIQSFAQSMVDMHQLLPKEKDNYFHYEKERFFLDAAQIYCDAIISLNDNLRKAEMKSAGLLTFREYISGFIQSSRFTTLLNETQKLLSDLASVRYSVHTKELHVEVLPYHSETDYSEEVERTFEKFKQEPVNDYKIAFPGTSQMNHIEAAILKGVAQLYPDIFSNLESFYAKNQTFQDVTIATFDREIQFYISWLDYISQMKKSGLKFCYPQISPVDKNVFTNEGFDVALAHQLVKRNISVVSNDFYLKDGERIIIVTGPNQGGKTTFARTFGQLHYLAVIGCCVPGRDAKLFLFDKLFVHFEEQENIENLRSKLEEDLVRIHSILTESTPRSIIIMNEILSSTTIQDAIFLSKKIMAKINDRDALCVWVTFIEELLVLNKKTVSMVSTVVPENPAERTFKVERRPADGLAYALSIAEKYHVTYSSLIKRIKP